MTGGLAVILGPVGDNFAAGMTGGMAFVYDADGLFEEHVNPDTVIWQRIESIHWEGTLYRTLEEHRTEARSSFAAQILARWEHELGRFWQVVPKEMIDRLAHPLTDAPLAATA
jgi:glutamate synthase (NADPH/NADH) large chain